jgi:hypothetical protein
MKNIYFRYIKSPIHRFYAPLTVVKHHWPEFRLWFIFTLLAGQLGVILNVIIRAYSYNMPITYSLYIDSLYGNFYIFSIATVASMLGPLFNNIIESKELKFKRRKVNLLYLHFSFYFSQVLFIQLYNQLYNQIIIRTILRLIYQ